MFLLTITRRAWVMVSDTQAALSRGISSSGSANVPLSKPGETSGPRRPHRYISRCHFMYFSDCIVREEGAIMWWREAEYSRSLFGELARGSWRSSDGTAPNSHNVQWQEQVVIVSHSEKYWVTLSMTTGHSTRLPSSDLCQVHTVLAAPLIRCCRLNPEQQLHRTGIYFGQ